jgi:GTPase SAR1 family protein
VAANTPRIKMSKLLLKKSNLLGDLRAENDIAMLDVAFYETMDYKTLIESSDRIIVVGRRGTGKSALYYKLKKYWEKTDKVVVIEIAPEEDQVIGTRPCLELFGSKFQHIRAGVRLVWRYALFLEIACKLESIYKFDKAKDASFLKECINKWKKLGTNVSEKCKIILKQTLDLTARPEERIGDMVRKLQLKELEEALSDVIDQNSYTCVILMDRLDEGYEPDDYGIGFVDGVVQAIIDLKTRLPKIRPTIFIRDNIFRAIATYDLDYSRNIEGQVLRLHWDEYQLFNLVCQRLRIAFKYEAESNLKLWNRCTSQTLQGTDGYKKCLQLTLYRPRDVLALLNDTFLLALKEERNVIIDKDMDSAAKSISNNRLDDLRKEYSALIPGLQIVTAAFAGRNPSINVSQALSIIGKLIARNFSASLTSI